MRVLSWAQSPTRLRGPHCSKKKPEFQHGSAPPVGTCSSSGPRRRWDVDELHDGWHPAMLSIGTFGIRRGRRDELERMQQDLTSLMRAKAVTTTAEEDEEDRRRHLTPTNGGIARHSSFRKLVSSVFSGFLPRLSFRGTTPDLRPTEIPWPLPHNDIPAENLVMSEAMIKKLSNGATAMEGQRDGGRTREQMDQNRFRVYSVGDLNRKMQARRR